MYQQNVMLKLKNQVILANIFKSHFEILKNEHCHLFRNPIITQNINFRQNLTTLKNPLIMAAILGGHFEIFKNEHHHFVQHPINTQYTNFRQNL